MKTIVLASNNQGKLHELQTLFAPLGVEIVAQGKLFSGEAEEPFQTFVENALAKARFAAKHSGLPAIADDAGLCVKAFGGLPGVQTAHYCQQFGYPKSDANNVRALLEQMADLSDRSAYMVSTLVGVRQPQDPEPLIAVGKVAVHIAPEPRGEQGFGFDPVLLLPELGQTFAQLPEATKNQYSHRGRAARTMCELVRQYWL
ncbi:non-canonical purine NTP pyrophosphatase, RdgB/HAM1 family [Vandammella animalimorsus]|uniref:dITP/XTP pyrophosphatase n=1 Tax=Vandammella animalimorsus TaxID=2029117 RepID=A0A2A2T9E0_9BURK|nr:RdgB/HAM1 family non-canonical purine NTP pyrophosphatase [Vandammella animalimorsus]PAT33339.1 non-canonical purine NTP pyrophosphatase, RdgB/HAM1 family [Vandammella animalimorsus]PAT42038.1 non-canonical purine NTP pyrophosphatase, RdgB/HAM1 family [Vandammella animalimorsus]PAX18421.1 non-canonical purine NTP pyrophosphatase, RdgB/HAM1 family [Vandammella animalimorsus]PAX20585.1 non-canonical purine NTP pyrophosphatase, RdgB/HAM1 family [Vandammella animalimorsus]